MQWKKIAAVLAVASGLFGCGGGGSDVDPVAPGAAAPVGIWTGTTNNNRVMYTAILGNNSYWTMYTNSGTPSAIAGFNQGTWRMESDTLVSSIEKDFSLESGAGMNVQSSFTATRQSGTLIARLIYANSSVTALATPMAQAASTTSAAAGTYSGTTVTQSGQTDTVTLLISSQGTVLGSSSLGCSFAGQITPRPELAVFDLTITFGGGTCALGTSTVRGVIAVNASQAVAAALDTDRTTPFMFLGTRI